MTGSAARQKEHRPPPFQLHDLHDRLVDPLHTEPGTRAVVFVFVRADCPISNRYAPDVRLLTERFAPEGVRFWLVYLNSESADAIRAHIQTFEYPIDALRDPQRLLATRAGIVVTPEAAIFAPNGRLVYHGRIDDRYVDFGIQRPAATRFDVRDALASVLAGRPVASAVTKAVGCLLSDLAQ